MAGVLQDKGLKAVSHLGHDPGKLALGEPERVARNPVTSQHQTAVPASAIVSLLFNRIVFLHEIGSYVRSTHGQ